MPLNPTCWDRISRQQPSARNGQQTSHTSGHVKAGFICLWSLICSHGGDYRMEPQCPYDADPAVTALKQAIALRHLQKGVHHDDRGSQYCSENYRRLLSAHGFIVSMSRKGNCWNNAVTEGFFKALKAELLWRQARMTRQKVVQAITCHINDFLQSAEAAFRTIMEKPSGL